MAVATATALLIGAGVSAVGAGYSIHAGEMAKKKAKGVADRQGREISAEKTKAEGIRKTMIKDMRSNIGGYSLNKTSNTGLLSGSGEAPTETLG